MKRMVRERERCASTPVTMEHRVENLWRYAQALVLAAEGMRARCKAADMAEEPADGLVELADIVAVAAMDLREHFFWGDAVEEVMG